MNFVRTLRRLPAALMISAVLGCDNVEWGGIELALEAPPVRDTMPSVDTTNAVVLSRPLPSGPLVYLLDRTGQTPLLHPLFASGPDGPEPLAPAEETAWWDALLLERFQPDRTFDVFSRGVRVGTFTPAPGFEASATFCGAGRAATGRIELLPEAMAAERLIAVARGAVAGVPEGPFPPASPLTAHQASSRSVMGQLIPELGVSWPPDLDAARAALDLIDLGGESPALAATFLYRDQLAVGPAPETAYAIFYLAASTGPQGYRADFVRHRAVGNDGKAVTSYVDHVDWDDDGSVELLLEVLGAEDRWFAALESGADGWEVTWEGSCAASG